MLCVDYYTVTSFLSLTHKITSIHCFSPGISSFDVDPDTGFERSDSDKESETSDSDSSQSKVGRDSDSEYHGSSSDGASINDSSVSSSNDSSVSSSDDGDDEEQIADDKITLGFVCNICL